MVIITSFILLIPIVSSTVFQEEKIQANIKTIELERLEKTKNILEEKSVIRIAGCFENYNNDLIIERLKIFQIGIMNPIGIYFNVEITGKSYSISFFESYPI